MYMNTNATLHNICRIMETYEMRTMFTLNMEGLQLRLYQFSSLLDQILPELSDFLNLHEVNVPMYASQWFLTLFAYAFPMELILRIYDIVFAEGAAETIMRVSIAMLKRSQEKLLKLNEFEDILDFLSNKLYDSYNNDPTQVISDAVELSGLITKEKMDHIAETYVAELEQEQKQTEQVLAVRFNFWSKNNTSSSSSNSHRSKNRKKKTMSWYSTSSATTPKKSYESERHSSSSLREPDVSQLHHQIEDLLLALQQTQRESIELKDDLMQARLDKMDVEAERDALKMTMASAFHNTKYERESIELRRENAKLKQENDDLLQQQSMSKDALTALVERMLDMKNRVDTLEQENLKSKLECQRLEKDKRRLQMIFNSSSAAVNDYPTASSRSSSSSSIRSCSKK